MGSAVSQAIGRLNPTIKRQARSTIDRVLLNPHKGKPLRDELEGYWNCRVGRMRLIYHIAPGRLVELIAVGPRETIYQEATRLVQANGPLGR
jgi:mRNA interferase RelE/StbE